MQYLYPSWSKDQRVFVIILLIYLDLVKDYM